MKNQTIVVLLVVALLAGAGSGYLTGSANVRTTTAISTFTEISTTSVTTFVDVSQYENSSFSYITSSGRCTAGGVKVACAGSLAYVFNACPNLTSGPPAPYTCTYTMTLTGWNSSPPYPTYTFNITLGVMAQASEPSWANCALPAAGEASSYADCVPIINSTAFIVGFLNGPVP